MQNMQSTNGFLINIKFEVMCFESLPFLDTALPLDNVLKTKVNALVGSVPTNYLIKYLQFCGISLRIT